MESEQKTKGNATSKLRSIIIFIMITLLSVLFYMNFSFFVIQPIGAIPEGKTLLIKRVGKLNFIDSADAICDRTQGGVSLLCRGIILGKIGKESEIYLRLPYSKFLYSISTNGKSFAR